MIDPVTLLNEYHAALNTFDTAKVTAMFAEDATYVSPGLSGEIKGRDAIMQAMAKYFAEYSDQVSTDERIEQLAEFKVKSIWRLIATNRAGEKIKRKGEEVIDFNAQGLIKRIEVKDDAGY